MKPEDTGWSSNEPEFAVFCIENVAARLNVDAEKVYAALTEQTDILKELYFVNSFSLKSENKFPIFVIGIPSFRKNIIQISVLPFVA